MHMPIVLAALLAAVAPAAFAHGTSHDKKAARKESPKVVEEKPFGRAGDPGNRPAPSASRARTPCATRRRRLR